MQMLTRHRDWAENKAASARITIPRFNNSPDSPRLSTSHFRSLFIARCSLLTDCSSLLVGLSCDKHLKHLASGECATGASAIFGVLGSDLGEIKDVHCFASM